MFSFKDFNDLFYNGLLQDFSSQIYDGENPRYEEDKNIFLFDLATKFKVEKLGSIQPHGNLNQFATKEDLKTVLREIIINNGQVKNKGDYTYHEFMAKVRIAAFICMARNFDISFTMEDLQMLAFDDVKYANTFSDYLFNKSPMTEILGSNEVKKLVTDTTFGHEQIENLYDQDEFYENPNTQYMTNYEMDSQQEEINLGSLIYLKDLSYESQNSDTFTNLLLKEAENGFKNIEVTELNANDFFYKLATKANVQNNGEWLDNASKDGIINKIKEADIKEFFDIGGDSSDIKAKVAIFICVARNFNIEFSIEDINNLADNHDLIDRYPINDMLKDEEIKKLMTGGNKISEKPSYDSNPNKSEVSLGNAWDEKKQKLAVALSQYFSYTNDQDKATAIKDLETNDIKKIVDCDNLSKGRFNGNANEKKGVVLNFLGLYDRISSVDERVKIKISSIRSKINMIKDPSLLGRIFDKVLGFFSSCGKAISSFIMDSHRIPPSTVFGKRNKTTALAGLDKLEIALDEIIKKEKENQKKPGER